MLRWPLLIIGIIIIILAVIMDSKNKPLSETAEKITVDEALEYLQSGDTRFVEIDAGVDSALVVYGTLSRNPQYTLVRTDRSYRLENLLSEFENPEKFAGTAVESGQMLSGNLILLQLVSEDKEAGTKYVLRERVLAHVTDNVWILSPMLKKGDLGGRQTWLSKNSYKGGFIYFRDLIDTVKDPRIENKLSEILDFALTEFGIKIPDNACVIIDGYESDYIPKAYYPLKGTDKTVFLVADPRSEPWKLTKAKGIFYPSPASYYSELLKLLNKDVSGRVAAIVQEDAGAYNLRKHNDVRATYTAGGIILILALTGFLRKRLKKASVT